MEQSETCRLGDILGDREQRKNSAIFPKAKCFSLLSTSVVLWIPELHKYESDYRDYDGNACIVVRASLDSIIFLSCARSLADG